MAHRGRLLLRLVLLAGACGPAVAGEFLGSVDSGADSQAAADDGSWIDYLAQTDIGKVAKTADPNGIPRAGQVATGTPPPASGDKKDD